VVAPGEDCDTASQQRGFTEWAIDATAQLFDVGIAAGNLQPFDTHNVARALTTASRVTTAR
jgi:hypothetical protein